MKGKRWLCVLLGALLALSLGLFAACGNTEEEQQTVAVASVTVSPATLSLTEGESGTLTATIAPENATEKAVTWSSSNEEVAAVENGEVTAVGHGTAENITVSGSITAGRGNGGVVGRMTVSGAIRGCTNNAAVTGVDAGGNTGGIVGHLYNYGLVRENVNTAEEISAQLFASGIVGSLQFEAKNVVSALEKDTDVDIVYNASATAATGIAADFTHVYVYNNMTDGTTYDRVLEPNFATEEALDEALAALAE